MTGQIKVEGLPELRKAVKELGDVATTREFKAAGYDVANEVVIPRAQSRAGGLGRMYVRAADTLKAARIATGGGIRLSNADFPGTLGAEFGAMANQLRNTRSGTIRGWNQFRGWRGSGPGTGYFLWPTIREDSELILDAYNDRIDPLVRRLFPEGG